MVAVKSNQGKDEPRKVEEDSVLEEIGPIERKEYDRLKRRAIKFESTNRKYILVLPCDGNQGWCEVSEHSALIYKYKVCLELGASVTMTDDFDSFYIQYDIGRIRTRGYDTVRRRIKKAGLYWREIVKDKCVVFELNTAFSEKEIAKMHEEEVRRQNEINSIVKVQFADPILFQMITEVATRFHRICFRRMDRVSSATNGERIVNMADEMIRLYYDLTMKKKTHEERMVVWEKMMDLSQKLLVEVQIVAMLKLWTRDACVKVGEKVLELQKRIEKNLAYEAKRYRK